MELALSARSKLMRRNWLLSDEAVVEEAPLTLPREMLSFTKNRRVLLLRRRRPRAAGPGLSNIAGGLFRRRLSGGSSRKLRVDPPLSKMGSARAMTLRALWPRFKVFEARRLFMLFRSLLLGVVGGWLLLRYALLAWWVVASIAATYNSIISGSKEGLLLC